MTDDDRGRPPAASPTTRSRRLLVVDDEPDVAEPLIHVAAERGYETRLLTSAEALEETLDSFAPTHVVVDLIMPGKDGIDILMALGKRAQRPRIFVVTGYHWGVMETARILAESFRLTDIEWLNKPVDLERFDALLDD